MHRLSGLGRRVLLSSLPTVGLMVASARAQHTKVKMGTAMDGGGVQTYGLALADAVGLADPGFEIQPVTTKGIWDNVTMLERGELDIGLVFGEVAHELFAGVKGPPTKLKVVSVMYPLPGMFVVRAESRYRGIADLTGRPVIWNGRNSGLATQARYVMDGLGLDIDRDFEPIYTTKLSQGPELMLEGRAAALWGSGTRWPGFVTLTNNPRGARFVAPNAAEIARIRARHRFFGEFVIPAGMYRGQYDPIVTVGTWSLISARDGLDDAVGYRLAAALHKAERTGRLTKLLADSTGSKTVGAIASSEMLQPGVARYYKEAGLLP
jgi:uncharacterized protein